eukprot:CAMPEP_0170579780 /NCGR_PEP_ID=MMETSP0224-20130122/6159_1 /TAXON_ID=285029 /ORGANISM="Togula jolla, Strain CCCM 725" /LENGTH=121 /DNA_ID=CAMNT_0010902813 /DNA_START=150 /DNA_END=516 /DNA_ORIENTATION=+
MKSVKAVLHSDVQQPKEKHVVGDYGQQVIGPEDGQAQRSLKEVEEATASLCGQELGKLVHEAERLLQSLAPLDPLSGRLDDAGGEAEEHHVDVYHIHEWAGDELQDINDPKRSRTECEKPS